jgi:hypothetical protein
MRTSQLLLTAVGLAQLVSVVACSRSPWQIDRRRARLEHLELGMSKNDVLAVMGKAHKKEAFYDKDGTPTEVLVYETEYTDSGGFALEKAFTPVVLRSGKVIGWGANMYDQTTKHDVRIELGDREDSPPEPE